MACPLSLELFFEQDIIKAGMKNKNATITTNIPLEFINAIFGGRILSLNIMPENDIQEIRISLAAGLTN